ncbi:MAG: aminotransferase class III-fold pyridoxal phosphate-dependent enzyme, partial [Myxococcota bacterium]
RSIADADAVWLPSLHPGQPDERVMLESLGRLYTLGASVHWAGVFPPGTGRLVSLPRYPFQRRRFWNDAAARRYTAAHAPEDPPAVPMSMAPHGLSQPDHASTGMVPDADRTARGSSDSSKHDQVRMQTNNGNHRSPRQTALLAELRQIAARLLRMEPDEIVAEQTFLELGADSIILTAAVRRLEDHFGIKLEIRQFFEELDTPLALATYLDAALPDDWRAPDTAAVPTIQAHGRDAEAPAPAPVVVRSPVESSALPGPAAATEQLTVQPQRPTGTQLRTPAPPAAAPAIVSRGEFDSELLGFLGQHMQLMQRHIDLLQGTHSGREQSSVAAVAPSHPAPLPPTQPAGGTSFLQASTLGRNIRTLTPEQRAFVAQLTARYTARTARSKQAAADDRPAWADMRSSMGFAMELKELCYPIRADRSQGAYFWDIDGNRYVDISMGFGVNLFGHRPDFIHHALHDQLDEGIQVGPDSKLVGQVCQLLREHTGMSRFTFCNSGTEAMMTAIRLARAATGRDTVVMFSGSYHGHSDPVLVVKAPPDSDKNTLAMVAGVPQGTADDTVVLEYNNPESLKYIRALGSSLAAVVVEPVQSRNPGHRPREFLGQLHALTRELGALLVFDEVLIGFRIGPGGAQAYFDVKADITAYGKIAGGGLPFGVVAGRDGAIDAVDGGLWHYGDDSYPAVPKSYVAGTFCKHPLAMRAAVAVLTRIKELGPELHRSLNARMAWLAGHLNTLFADGGYPLTCQYFGSLFRLVSRGNSSYFYQPVEIDLLFYSLIQHGVYTWEGRTCYISAAHSDDDLYAIIDAFQVSLRELRAGGFFPAPARRVSTIGERPAAGPPPLHGGLTPCGTRPRTPANIELLQLKDPTAAMPLPQADIHRHPPDDLQFGLYYFGAYAADYRSDKYRLLLDSARWADAEGLSSLWIPERHFHAFGGISPNPSVLGAALARETQRIQLRAGSVVLP